MRLPVSLQEVVEEMQVMSDEMTAYINRKTGELITLTDEDVRLAEDPEPSEDLPDWQEEMLPKVREVLDSKDYIALPDKFEINEWSMMREFSSSQPNGDGRGASTVRRQDLNENCRLNDRGAGEVSGIIRAVP